MAAASGACASPGNPNQTAEMSPSDLGVLRGKLSKAVLFDVTGDR
jgi:hypothetical protein